MFTAFIALLLLVAALYFGLRAIGETLNKTDDK
jgi:hypothetical protein